MTAATCELSEGTARLCRGSPCVLASCFSVCFCLASVPSGVGLSQLPDPQKGAALFFGGSCYLWNFWLGAGLSSAGGTGVLLIVYPEAFVSCSRETHFHAAVGLDLQVINPWRCAGTNPSLK